MAGTDEPKHPGMLLSLGKEPKKRAYIGNEVVQPHLVPLIFTDADGRAQIKSS